MNLSMYQTRSSMRCHTWMHIQYSISDNRHTGVRSPGSDDYGQELYFRLPTNQTILLKKTGGHPLEKS